jgi:hypothetical protein
MLKKKAVAIADVYVPVKRRQTLDPQKVEILAESILARGQDTPFSCGQMAAGCAGGGATPTGSLRALGETTVSAYLVQARQHCFEESWDGGIGVLAAKVKAGVPNWDVIQVEAEELALGCADGFYEKIDWSKVGGKRQVPTRGRGRLRGRRHRVVHRAEL